VISTNAVVKCFTVSAERADYVLHPASEGVCVNLRKTMILLQVRRSRRTVQVEYGMLPDVKDMHVRRVMVVQINHGAGSADAENRWHVVTLSISCVQVNRNAWVFRKIVVFRCKT
jgi:hypothetical protein